MSTRGDITVVSEGHYYSHYQHCDMYPSGHIASLLREAADITRQGQWDEVTSGWVQKTWLVPEDDELPRSLHNTVKHPDGDDYKRSDWSYGMRPRLSYADMVAAGYQCVADELFKGSKHDHGLAAYDRPGIRAAAEMPAMLKEDFGQGWWKEYGLAIDLDNREIVCLDYRPRPKGNTIRIIPMGVAPLDDPDEIEGLAAWASEFDPVHKDLLDPPPSPDRFAEGDVYARRFDERLRFHPSVGGPPVVPYNPYDTYAERAAEVLEGCPDLETIEAGAASHTSRDWRTAGKSLHDGMWLRPRGFPELPNPPWQFPAQRYLSVHPDGSPTADALPRAGAAQGWGTPLTQCTHIGVRNKKRCVRQVHSDDHHRYEHK